MAASAPPRDRTLTSAEKAWLALLALPTLGLALAITVVSTYVPVLARRYVSSTIVIGVIVGAEGLAATVVPLAVGTWSDRLRTRLGGRLPFVLAGTPVAALALVAMGLAHALIAIVVAVIVFFLAYFVAYSPYRALYPDLLANEVEGRAQSAQAVARGVGTMVALAAGGVLLSVAQITPFVTAAGLLVTCTAAFSLLLLRRGGEPDRKRGRSRTLAEAKAEIRRLLSERRELRAFLTANLLWELTLAAIKTFVVLWLTAGLHHSLSLASGAIGGTAALILAAAALSGRLADRHGRLKVMRMALWCWGAGMLIPIAVTSPPILAVAVPLVAIGGGVTMALPYALLIPMMPPEEHGTVTGLYGISRGLGIMLGPLLAGAAIQVAGGLLPENGGYGGMWFVAAAAAFGSLLALRRVQPADR